MAHCYSFSIVKYNVVFWTQSPGFPDEAEFIWSPYQRVQPIYSVKSQIINTQASRARGSQLQLFDSAAGAGKQPQEHVNNGPVPIKLYKGTQLNLTHRLLGLITFHELAAQAPFLRKKEKQCRRRGHRDLKGFQTGQDLTLRPARSLSLLLWSTFIAMSLGVLFWDPDTHFRSL